MPNQIIPDFDFSDVAALSVEERIARSIDRARELIDKHGIAQFHQAPMIPDGATADELAALERELGIDLPPEPLSLSAYAGPLGRHARRRA